MALSNKERIGRLLDRLAAGLGPVVNESFTTRYGPTWISTVEAQASGRSGPSDPTDPQFLLNAIWFHWNDTLGKTLGHVAELRVTRSARCEASWHGASGEGRPTPGSPRRTVRHVTACGPRVGLW